MDLTDRVLASYNPLADTRYIEAHFEHPSDNKFSIAGQLIAGAPIALVRGGLVGAAVGLVTGYDLRSCIVGGALLSGDWYIGCSLLHYTMRRLYS